MSSKIVIIPDNVLDVLLCDNCHKYLSVKPIRVGYCRILCGRCSDENNVEYVSSRYGTFAENALFKCINHFDGCNTFLSYDQVSEHEEQCNSENYECILCPDKSSEIPIYMLLYHVKTVHRKYFLMENCFTVELIHLKINSFFYRIDNNLFFIKQSFDSTNKSISLHFIGIGKRREEFPRIQIKFFIKLQDDDVLHSDSQPWLGLDFDGSTNNSKCVIAIDNAKNNQFITIHFEISTTTAIQLVQIEPHITVMNKEVENQNALTLESRIKKKLSSVRNLENAICQSARRLKFNSEAFPYELSGVLISSCRTKLIVNEFVDSTKKGPLSICYHCILCNCLCKRIASHYVFNYDSSRHLICYACAKFIKKFNGLALELVNLHKIISEVLFSGLKYSCINRCDTFESFHKSFPTNKNIIINKSCCMENCDYIATSFSCLVDHFMQLHKVQLHQAENYSIQLYFQDTYTVQRKYLFANNLIFEIIMFKKNPALKKYSLSANICENKANLCPIMHIFKSCGEVYVNTFFKTEVEVDTLALRFYCFTL